MSEELVRLSKRISELGIASRREADAWIEKGWVKVNGEIATLGMKVTHSDRIQISSKAKNEQKKLVTILLNKPVGYVSGQAEDGYEPAKVLGLEGGEICEGGVADIAIVDLDADYVVDGEKFLSKGKNTPFNGYRVWGKVLKTLVDGKVKYDAEKL